MKKQSVYGKILLLLIGLMTVGIQNIGYTHESGNPHFPENTTTRSVEENVDAGTNIGAPVAAHSFGGPNDEYRLLGTDAGSFDIDSTTGQLKTKVALDHETKNSYNVRVGAYRWSRSTGWQLEASIPVTINVTDQTWSFHEGSSTTRSIAENTPGNRNIGSPVEAEHGTFYRYRLTGTDAGSFSIVSSTGQLQTQSPLDYETENSYTVTVSVQEGIVGQPPIWTNRDSITVTINVENKNEKPTFDEGTTATRSVKENTAGGVTFGDPLAATDPDITSTNGDANPETNTHDVLTYSLKNTGDAAAFEVEQYTGRLKTGVLTTLDYETKPVYTVTVVVSDGTLTSETVVTINIENVIEAPVITEGETATRSIPENTAAGVNIGAPFTATNPDNSEIWFDFSSPNNVDHDNASFQLGVLDPNTGLTTGQIRTSAALNFERKNTYTVRLDATVDTG